MSFIPGPFRPSMGPHPSPFGARISNGRAAFNRFASGVDSAFASRSPRFMNNLHRGVGIGLGLMALSQGRSTIDRIRYGQYGSAVLSAGMAGAAGYGAYRYGLLKGSMRADIGRALGQIGKFIR